MTEHQMEFLEKNFPDGFILICTKPSKSADPMGNPITLYVKDPEKSALLQEIANLLVAYLSGEDEEDDEDLDDELGLFK